MQKGILNTYYTYGNFDTSYGMFKQIALIMSDQNYKYILFSVLAMGCVMGNFKALYEALKSSSSMPILMMGFQVLIGMVFYFCCVEAKDTVLIHDKTYNRIKEVESVPKLFAYTACFSSALEKLFVDMVSTSSDLGSYEHTAGGNILEIVQNFFKTPPVLEGRFDNQTQGLINLSLHNYINDCFSVEVARNDSKIDRDLVFSSMDYMSLLSGAANPSIWTTFFGENHKAGVKCTCQQAWKEISSSLNDIKNPQSTEVKEHIKKAALNSGLTNNESIAPRTESFLKKVTGIPNINIGQIFVQWLIGSELWKAVNNGDYVSIADHKTGLSMTGMGESAASWLPITKSITLAAFFGMFPFLATLLITHFAARAIKIIVGVFIFFMLWGICDVILHQIGMQKILSIFESLHKGRLGLRSLLMFESTAAKALAVVGSIKCSSMMLAGIISTSLTGFGGHIMGHFASSVAQAGQHSSAAASNVFSPSESATSLQRIAEASPTHAVANYAGLGGMQRGYMINQFSSLENSKYVSDNLGGSMTAGSRTGHAHGISTLESVGRADSIEGSEYEKGGIEGKESLLEAHASGEIQDLYSNDEIVASKEHEKSQRFIKASINQAGAQYLETGEISDATKNSLNKTASTLEGKSLMSQSGTNLHYSNISATQSENVNRLAKAAGKDIRVEPNDSVSLDLGYDPESGSLSAFNIKAQNMASRDIGQKETYTNFRESEGIREVASGYRAFYAEQSEIGKSEPVNSEARMGRMTSINEDTINYSTGLFTRKNIAENQMVNSMLISGSSIDEAIRKTATTTGLAKEIGSLTTPSGMLNAGIKLTGVSFNNSYNALKRPSDFLVNTASKACDTLNIDFTKSNSNLIGKID